MDYNSTLTGTNEDFKNGDWQETFLTPVNPETDYHTGYMAGLAIAKEKASGQ